MKNNRNTFLEYLKTDRFYEQINKSIFSWCIGNKDLLIDKLDGYNVSYIAQIEDELDLEYINVWIDSKENTKIEFDIAIEVTVNVEGVAGKRHDRDNYSARVWVMVTCCGSLDKKLNDFYILGVDEFVKTKPKRPLSGDFVPYIKKSEYDDYANVILENYYFKYHPDAKTKPVAIDVDELAARMGLTVQNTSISEDRSLFGQIYFADTEAKLYNSTVLEYENVQVNKNTILVDTEAAYLRSFGSRNMTVAHECVHAYYHRKAFLFAQMFNEDLHYIQCQVNGVMKHGESNTTTEWMEIQANGIAPYILMPKESFLAYAKHLFEYYNVHGGLETYTINDIIRKLADTFEVTIYAARKRLIDLGFEVAIGAYNWVDGYYVRPYAFKKGSLASNETFTISYKDVYKKLMSDPQIAMSVVMNHYVFVENHLCLNHPDYIEKNLNGDLMLTDYALVNMHECCVKFKYKTIQGFNEGSDFGLMCYLSRDTSKELEFDLEITNNPASTLNDPKFNERYRIHNENVEEVITAISNLPFRGILDYLMKYLDISIKELEIDSGINERTIRRYIKGENKEPEKRTVVALLRALNLPYKITDIAVKQAGISFVNGNDEDTALLTVMTAVRRGSARDANNFMKSLEFEPLTQDLKKSDNPCPD